MAYSFLIFLAISFHFAGGVVVPPPKTDWNKLAKDNLDKALKKTPNTNLAKNIILFIGDGFGVTTLTAARIYKGQKNNKPGEETVLKFEEWPNVGLSKTYGNDRQVSDSAQTATALMSGVKTNFYVVGANDNVKQSECEAVSGNEVKSILHHFQDVGRSTGVVTTARLTHATPASAYAHTANRDWENNNDVAKDAFGGKCKDIAYQLVYNNSFIQVAMGGGRRNFLSATDPDPETGKPGNRTDGVNLMEEWKRIQKEKGRTAKAVTNLTDFNSIVPSTTDSVLGLFEPSHMQYEASRDKSGSGEPSLTEMTDKAIRILQKNSKGFFLMVEGARIDHAHHDNTARKALEETISMEEAVIKAMELTNQDETLIIVTGDHSHVFTFGGYPYRGNHILGLANPLDYEPSLDDLPYTTLAYGNGPGYSMVNGMRQNITNIDTETIDYAQQSAVPVASESHGGEDVPIFAIGPMSHAFYGVHEQNYVGHVMQYAACVGNYANDCNRPVRSTNVCSSTARPVFSIVNIIVMLCVGLLSLM